MTLHPTVLVVDDEAEFATTLAKRLSLRGFETRVALSGSEALECIAAGPVDLVVLDVLMPGMDGCETLIEIRKTHPLVPVLMLTGKGTVDRAVAGMKAGAIDFLMKPCDITAISERLIDAFRKKRDHESRIRDAEICSLLGRKGW